MTAQIGNQPWPRPLPYFLPLAIYFFTISSRGESGLPLDPNRRHCVAEVIKFPLRSAILILINSDRLRREDICKGSAVSCQREGTLCLS